MPANNDVADLRRKLGEISDIHNAIALLQWDQETCMPPKGAEARSFQLATLSALKHRLFTAESMGNLVRELYAQSDDLNPADAKLVEITHLEHDPSVDGPAVRLGIFLSIFNVHINRSPSTARVLAVRYSPGEFRNALDPTSAQVNEHTWIALEEESPPHRKMIVRQISGAIARRIVCDLRPGEVVARGEKLGMIKFGSRTELILPETDNLRIVAQLGDRIRAGASVLAEYQ